MLGTQATILLPFKWQASTFRGKTMVKLPGGSEDPPSIYLTCPLSDGVPFVLEGLGSDVYPRARGQRGSLFGDGQRPQRWMHGWMPLSARGWNDFKNLVGVLADGKIEWFV